MKKQTSDINSAVAMSSAVASHAFQTTLQVTGLIDLANHHHNSTHYRDTTLIKQNKKKPFTSKHQQQEVGLAAVSQW